MSGEFVPEVRSARIWIPGETKQPSATVEVSDFCKVPGTLLQ